MRLQKRFLRRVNGKDYYKYMVNLPPESVKEAGFREGEELEAEAKKGEIRMKRR